MFGPINFSTDDQYSRYLSYSHHHYNSDHYSINCVTAMDNRIVNDDLRFGAFVAIKNKSAMI